MKIRLDRLLLEKGLVSSRNQASELISEGVVLVNGEVTLKASLKLDPQTQIEIKKEYIFVGRGAHKMQGAQESFNLSFGEKIVGDMGASTGGFTEFALFKGARKVYAVDVGVGQLAQKLADDERVENLEGLNIREGLPFNDCDLLVADLSFISLKKVIEPMANSLKSSGEFVFLVKPQFEVGLEGLGKNAIVKDQSMIIQSVSEVIEFCHEQGLSVCSCRPCAIKGKMGNQEYFIYGVKDPMAEKLEANEVKEIIKATL